ncbi:hypothetical protein CW674_02480 [Macrococcoides caseolyticum]|uniref:hypothetical protein n=1 Tax=Macrococcoides caseolyticum TaxID=69966 RepID=UPI000C33E3DA|nr:hypothetical protein [Macrococcus caseolyticus]PKE66237.1 hypothetical protein CW674_02480 [Macrococcus caseolyticus]
MNYQEQYERELEERASELLDYELDELVDSVQYNRVAKQRTLQAVALLKQDTPNVEGAIKLLEG